MLESLPGKELEEGEARKLIERTEEADGRLKRYGCIGLGREAVRDMEEIKAKQIKQVTYQHQDEYPFNIGL